MCLGWPRKAPLDLTQAIQADSLSKKKYSMSNTAPNKESRFNEYLHKAGYMSNLREFTALETQITH